MDGSAIICDEVIESCNEEIKTIPASFSEKSIACKIQKVYILLAFLLITIALLIAASIYCYLIKYKAKQKQPFHITNNELKKIVLIIYCKNGK